MDLKTNLGEKVLFTGKGGYESNKEHANRYLTVGVEYTLSNIKIDNWSSTVELEEFPDIVFNSAHFENV